MKDHETRLPTPFLEIGHKSSHVVSRLNIIAQAMTIAALFLGVALASAPAFEHIVDA